MANQPPHPSLFARTLVAALLPYFQTGNDTSEAAVHAEALHTLNSYGATTRGGMLHAALAIAFGFSALEALAEAKQNPTLSSMQAQRIRAGANALGRACQQNARLAASRPACDAPNAHATPNARATATPAPNSAAAAQPGPAAFRPELSDEEITEILKQADATINACRDRGVPLLRPGAPDGPAPQHRESTLAQLFAQAARTTPSLGTPAGQIPHGDHASASHPRP